VTTLFICQFLIFTQIVDDQANFKVIHTSNLTFIHVRDMNEFQTDFNRMRLEILLFDNELLFTHGID
jgi:hypothetical protein